MTSTVAADQFESLVSEYQELQKRTRMWAALSNVGRVLSSTLEPDQVLQLILDQAVGVLEAEGGSLILVDRETRELVFELALGPTADDLIGTRMPWGVGLVGEAAATGQPLIVNDTATDPRWFSGYDDATDFVTQSILCAPMITRQQVMGVLEIVNKKDGSPFDEHEAELLYALAAQAATALTNAQLYTATRRQAEEVSTLLETSEAMTSTLDLDQRLEIIGNRAKELVNANGCVIYLLDDEAKMLRPILALDEYAEKYMQLTIPVGEGVSGRVVQTGEGRVVNRAHENPDAVWVPGTPYEPEALLSVPLRVRGMIIGTMTLSRQGEVGFTAHDFDLISSLGSLAAAAIENARLYSATRARNRELTVLYDVGFTVGQTLDKEEILHKVLRQMLEALEQAGGAIFLVDNPDELPVLAHHFQVSSRVLSFLVEHSWVEETMRIAVEQRAIVDQAMPEQGFNGIQRLVCAPLITHQRVLGVLVIPVAASRPMRSREKRLLETLGRQVGMALENATLYAELRARAETLQKAYDELAAVDRLRDELIQNISHELRTPITFVKGYVSLLLDGELGELNEEQFQSLEIVASKTEQLIQLVGSILTLQTVTADSLRREPISPIELASGAVEGAKLAAQEAGVKIMSIYPDYVLPVFVDASRITQVFDNLLQNAIKFSPGGGTITIRLRADRDMVRFEVADTGIGIPADKVDHIFDRFYQVDGSMTRRFGGAGLGLAICKQIIDAHGGEIWVESAEKQGSTFFFTLPIAD